MHSKIEHLSSAEKKLVLDAPILITALIAGADGDFHYDEIKKAVKIIHVKTYSEPRDVRGVYKSIDKHSEEMIDSLINHLPKTAKERNAILVERLQELNYVFPKLDAKFAHELYASLRELAYYVSNGGQLGSIDYHSEDEKHYAKLDFLNKPQIA